MIHYLEHVVESRINAQNDVFGFLRFDNLTPHVLWVTYFDTYGAYDVPKVRYGVILGAR